MQRDSGGESDRSVLTNRMSVRRLRLQLMMRRPVASCCCSSTLSVVCSMRRSMPVRWV
jgi:hypothetical protein